jgi:hypothetical protein
MRCQLVLPAHPDATAFGTFTTFSSLGHDKFAFEFRQFADKYRPIRVCKNCFAIEPFAPSSSPFPTITYGETFN